MENHAMFRIVLKKEEISQTYMNKEPLQIRWHMASISIEDISSATADHPSF